MGVKRKVSRARSKVRASKAKVRASKAKNPRLGGRFDAFLKEQGTYEETQAVAIKRVLAWQLAEEMRKQKVTKAEMARRMETSRSQLDRLLDPDIADVKLETLVRAARAVKRRLKLELAA